MQDQNEQSILEDLPIPVKRRTLLPWWIRGFCLLFMVSGVVQVIAFVLSFFVGDFTESVYGLEGDKNLSVMNLFLGSIFIYKGVTAWALWFEKDYAITLGLIDALIGIVICLVVMLVLPFITTGYPFMVRLELVLLIPYFIKLTKIKKPWEGSVNLYHD